MGSLSEKAFGHYNSRELIIESDSLDSDFEVDELVQDLVVDRVDGINDVLVFDLEVVVVDFLVQVVAHDQDVSEGRDHLDVGNFLLVVAPHVNLADSVVLIECVLLVVLRLNSVDLLYFV